MSSGSRRSGWMGSRHVVKAVPVVCIAALMLLLQMAPLNATATASAHRRRVTARRHATAAHGRHRAARRHVVSRHARRSSRSDPCGDVLAFQVRLDVNGLSPGEIDGRLGRDTRGALAAFQQMRGLASSGQPDCATWDALGGGLDPPVVDYEITNDDLAGPFVPDIPSDLTEQAKLPFLGYTSPLEALGEKFHCAPTLLRQLNPGADFSLAGQHIRVPNVFKSLIALNDGPPIDAPPDIVVEVVAATSSLTVRAPDGAVLFCAPATTGSDHDPLPIGEWKVTGVFWSPVFHYNPDLFWDAEPTHAKANVPPGPDNPVGVVWIGLDLPHYGIHGTPDPAKVGYLYSHGCVRLTNWDATRVARFVRPGTRVLFQ